MILIYLQRLGGYIRQIIIRIYLLDLYCTKPHFILDSIVLLVYMLCTFVLRTIFGVRNTGLVIL